MVADHGIDECAVHPAPMVSVSQCIRQQLGNPCDRSTVASDLRPALLGLRVGVLEASQPFDALRQAADRLSRRLPTPPSRSRILHPALDNGGDRGVVRGPCQRLTHSLVVELQVCEVRVSRLATERWQTVLSGKNRRRERRQRIAVHVQVGRCEVSADVRLRTDGSHTPGEAALGSPPASRRSRTDHQHTYERMPIDQGFECVQEMRRTAAVLVLAGNAQHEHLVGAQSEAPSSDLPLHSGTCRIQGYRNDGRRLRGQTSVRRGHRGRSRTQVRNDVCHASPEPEHVVGVVDDDRRPRARTRDEREGRNDIRRILVDDTEAMVRRKTSQRTRTLGDGDGAQVMHPAPAGADRRLDPFRQGV